MSDCARFVVAPWIVWVLLALTGSCFAAEPPVPAVATGGPPDSRAVATALAFKAETAHGGAEAPTGPRFADLPPFSLDGRWYAAIGGNSQNMVRIWDVEAERVVRRIKIPNGGIYQALFSPNNRILATCGTNGLQLFEVETGREIPRVLGARQVTSEVLFAPDCNSIFTLDGEKILRIDTATGQTRTTIVVPPSLEDVRGSRALTLSPGGDLVAVNNGDSICIWRVADGKEVRRILYQDPNVNYYGSIFSGSGALLASIGVDNSINVWEIATGLLLYKLHNELTMPESLSFSRDSRYLAASAGDSVIVWDALTGSEIVQYGLANEQGDDFLAERVAFTADNRHLVALIRDPEKRLPRRQTWNLSEFDGRYFHSDPLSDEERISAWETLAQRDAGHAFRAVRRLVSAGPDCVEWLDAKLREPALATTGMGDVEFGKLLTGLDHESYLVREKTAQIVRSMGRVAERLLQQSLGSQPSFEMRHRIERLLTELADSHRWTEFRLVRTIVVLELIGSDSAAQTLAWAAQESADPNVRRDANSALTRLRVERLGDFKSHGRPAAP